MTLNILTYPHPTLRQKSRELTHEEILNPEFKKFVQDLGETMIKNDGIGLAAPQVNKLIRVVVVNIDNKPKEFINPKIIRKSWRKNIMEEGCLSLPGIFGQVKRPATITLKYIDLNTQEHKTKISGLPARVLQHEIDHLEGILFIDRMTKNNFKIPTLNKN